MTPTPFATDDQIAANLRRVAGDLRVLAPAHARELIELARILDPACHQERPAADVTDAELLALFPGATVQPA